MFSCDEVNSIPVQWLLSLTLSQDTTAGSLDKWQGGYYNTSLYSSIYILMPTIIVKQGRTAFHRGGSWLAKNWLPDQLTVFKRSTILHFLGPDWSKDLSKFSSSTWHSLTRPGKSCKLSSSGKFRILQCPQNSVIRDKGQIEICIWNVGVAW